MHIMNVPNHPIFFVLLQIHLIWLLFFSIETYISAFVQQTFDLFQPVFNRELNLFQTYFSLEIKSSTCLKYSLKYLSFTMNISSAKDGNFIVHRTYVMGHIKSQSIVELVRFDLGTRNLRFNKKCEFQSGHHTKMMNSHFSLHLRFRGSKAKHASSSAQHLIFYFLV